MRNYRGYEYNCGYPLVDMSLDQVRQILSQDFLRQIDSILINGNLGDFGLAPDGPDIVRYLLDSGVREVSISTNGSMRRPDWWAGLADQRVVILWGIDGMSGTHELYRLDTDWHKIIDNARAYIGNGGRAVWKMIAFDHNAQEVQSCKRLSQDLGFERFWLVDHGRKFGPVFDRRGQVTHWLGTPESGEQDIKAMLTNHITWFDQGGYSWMPRQDRKISCHAKKIKEIYIAADGSVYPCCYLGFYPKTMAHPGNSQIRDLIRENNALEHGLDHSLSWFHQIEDLWARSDISSGRPYICINSCGAD